MIKIENTEVSGWEAAIRGARNPLNSWARSDSWFGCRNGDYGHTEAGCCGEHCRCDCEFILGANDYDLMKRLVQAGSDHSKFMRMINVTCDITAPMYWVSEHDTYKVGTVRNSCSFMHKGVSAPFSIKDFSVHDDRVYDILSPLPKKVYELKYPYETTEKRIFTCANGRKYDIYRNGKVVSHEFSVTDKTGRTRTFESKECSPSRTTSGYYELHLGGRNGEKWALHRLIATAWLTNPDPQKFITVNHINGNKGNNSVENLEWCSLKDNITAGFDTGLYENVKSLHTSYIKWKNSMSVLPVWDRSQLLHDVRINKLTGSSAAKKYNITVRQANNIIFGHNKEYEDLFTLCYTYEKIIDTLNQLRDVFLETHDLEIFQQIRCLLPSGYNIRYTWQANYAVLRNIYHARKNHKLDEWHTFCDWIGTLPYSELITM